MRSLGGGPAFAARVAVVAACFALLAWHVDRVAVLERLVHLDGRYVAAFLALSLPLYLLFAWRWRFTVTRLGAPLPFRDAFRDYYVSTLLNQVLPLGVAGDVARAARQGRRVPDGAFGAAARAVVLERFAGLLALLLFVSVSAIVWLVRGQRTFALFAGAGALVLLVPLVASKRLAARLPQRLRGYAAELRAALFDRGALAIQLAVSSVAVMLLITLFGCAAGAARVHLEPWAVVQIAPLMLAATTLPWAFAGLGPREASTALLFSLLGRGADDGVATALAFGALSLAAALPGVVLLAFEKRRAS